MKMFEVGTTQDLQTLQWLIKHQSCMMHTSHQNSAYRFFFLNLNFETCTKNVNVQP
jgi:hypothetical protein